MSNQNSIFDIFKTNISLVRSAKVDHRFWHLTTQNTQVEHPVTNQVFNVCCVWISEPTFSYERGMFVGVCFDTGIIVVGGFDKPGIMTHAYYEYGFDDDEINRQWNILLEKPQSLISNWKRNPKDEIYTISLKTATYCSTGHSCPHCKNYPTNYKD